MCLAERVRELLRRRAKYCTEAGCGSFRVRSDALVVHFVDGHAALEHCTDVSAPGPGRPPRLARRRELCLSPNLDPEPRLGAVGKKGVVRAARATRAEPTPLQERADDVPAVAHGMNQHRRGEG